MGFFDVFKKSKKEVIRENQHTGKQGEEQARREYEFSGHEVEKIHRGGDLKVTKRDWLTGKKEKPKIVEVKTGNSKLSKLQKKRQRQYGERYVVKRYDTTPLGLIPSSKSDKPKSKKKSSSYGFGSGSGLNDMFGSGSSTPRRTKRNNNYGFGSGSGLNDMFGTGSSRKKRSSNGWGF